MAKRRRKRNYKHEYQLKLWREYRMMLILIG